MSWVDLVIVVVVILAALHGRAVGAVRQVAGYLGLAVGFYLGTLIAPSLASHVTSSYWRPFVTLAIVLGAALLGEIAASLAGNVVAKAVRLAMLGIFDAVAGALVGALGALVGCWLVAGLLGSTTWLPVASAIQDSSILAAMNRVMPPLPSLEARVQTLLRNDNFPSIFANVVAPTLVAPVTPARLGPLVRHLSAPSDVVKVLASGVCATESEGTAFYVSAHEVVTNAHVVAGHTTVTVGGEPAHVALFDPKNDLAILRVPGVSATPLSLATSAPRTGQRIRVIGFPLNASRTAAPGYYEGALADSGRDIYNQDLTTRTVLALEVNIQPGNSGSPVFVGDTVAGVVESKSLSQTSTAYAIPASVVARDLALTPTAGSVSTEACLP